MSPTPRPTDLVDLLCALNEIKAAIQENKPVVGIDAGEVVLGCAFDDDGKAIGTVVAKFEKADELGGDEMPYRQIMFPFVAGAEPIDPWLGGHGPCGPMPSTPFAATVNADQLSSMEAVDSLDVRNPTCCPVRIVTSAGAFIVPAKEGFSARFDKPLIVQRAEFSQRTDCELSSITITGTR